LFELYGIIWVELEIFEDGISNQGGIKMKSSKSSFIEDLNGEKVLGEYLDKYFYEKLNIQDFFRNTSSQPNHMNNQYRGIDVTFNFNGFHYIVDEKATLQYPDGIPTFAFELRYKKNNQWRDGWFYDDAKETKYYLLAWPIRDHVKLSELQMDDIRKVEVMLISRKDLHEYLYTNYEITREVIEAEVDNIIKANTFGKLHPIHPLSNHYYYYTKNLAETPINLVVQKKTLKDLAIFHFITYRNQPFAKNVSSNIWLKSIFQKK
jgi:hypothetical protein